MAKNLPVKFVSENLFDDYTYSKKWHFDLFKENKYDIEMFGREIDPYYCDLKQYQDLFMMAYMLQNIPDGSKILDVGGGSSRILKYFDDSMECWNIDKFEGLGNGPLDKIDTTGHRLIDDYMGNFNKDLPDNYFDLVFSISTLEHVPETEQNYDNVLKDINRVLKPGGYSAHCMDVVWLNDRTVWTNPLLKYFFKNEKMINKWIPFEELIKDPSLYFMSEKFYDEKWKSATGKPYSEFGKPLSYNFIWRKAGSESKSVAPEESPVEAN